MAERNIRSMLDRQWRLVELVRTSYRGRSVQSLMEELKVSLETIDSDLNVLEGAGLPIERLKITDETRVLHKEVSTHNPAPLPISPSFAATLLKDAIKEKLEVHVSYKLPGTSGTLSFKLAPFRIEEVSGSPYLLARDLNADDWRLFEVARIVQVTFGDDHHELGPEQGERLFNELVENLGELIPVVVRLTPHGAYLVSDYPLTPSQMVESLPDGGRRSAS